MIRMTDLTGQVSRTDIAYAIDEFAPESVLDSDLQSQDVLTFCSIHGEDVHGTFGIATLCERPIETLSLPFRNNLHFQGRDTYHELSLVYSAPPKGLKEDPEQDENFTTIYCRIFYAELFDFLKTKLGGSALMVTTTEEESENMSFFGGWSFHESSCKGGVFQAVLKVSSEEDEHS